MSLINDILDFSKIETGKLELVAGDYALSSLINDVYHMLISKAKEKGLALNVESDKNLPAKLYGDEVRIRQIIVNILNNAIKYTKKGSVTLTVGMSELKPSDTTDHSTDSKSDDITDKNTIITFRIADTGIGIKNENISHLFDSFSRFDEEKNKYIEGTGLGLAITKQLVDLMNGEIVVTSEYGKGSVFTVSIPQKIVSDLKIGDISEKYNEPSNKKKKKSTFTAPDANVLVVDDVKMNINVFKALLKRTEINVDSAMSGSEALAMIKEKKYDIIFLDHMMPDMDGIETYQNMKMLEDNPNKDTTVVMLTANAIMGAKEEYLGIGFSDYLSKPVQAPKLEAMILKYLPEELVQRTTNN